MDTAPVAPPTVLVLDVNETLSDLGPLTERFAALGVPRDQAAHVRRLWFAATLRDGFALAVCGQVGTFADVGAAALRSIVPGVRDEAVDAVISGFSALGLHPDVAPGLRRLRSAGIRIVTLSNGSAPIAEGLLERGEVADTVERVLSVDDVGVWKPRPEAYAHALQQTGVSASEAMLVAVHPWDLHGAAHAGLRTAWVDRSATPWPGHFTAPDLRVGSFEELAEVLAGSSPR